MKVNAGLWIDHQRALIVITYDGGEKKLEIRADRFAGPNPYYTEVIGAIRDAEAILIFGPGEAGNELRHHLDRARLGGNVVAMEAADPMTDPQIAAKVRDHFQPSRSTRTPVSAGPRPFFTHPQLEHQS